MWKRRNVRTFYFKKFILYTINDTINKDINTKNVILDPFNSTFENNNDGSNKSRIYDNNLEIINNDVYFFVKIQKH